MTLQQLLVRATCDLSHSQRSFFMLAALAIAACSGSHKDSLPAKSASALPPTPPPLMPDTSSDPTLPSPSNDPYPAAKQAARFLNQATFGPTAKSLRSLMQATPQHKHGWSSSLPCRKPIASP